MAKLTFPLPILTVLTTLVSSVDYWLPSLNMMLAAIGDQMGSIVTQVSAPGVRGKAYRIYSTLYEMVESKLEWMGSKLTVLEERSMREQYSEQELQRVVSVEFASWSIEMDESYLTRIFKQEYHKLWHSRRRYALRDSELHRELCQGHVCQAADPGCGSIVGALGRHRPR